MSKSRAPRKIDNPELRRVIDDVYKELNFIKSSIGTVYNGAPSDSQGKIGDIAVYKDQFGKHILSIKTNNGWARIGMSIPKVVGEPFKGVGVDRDSINLESSDAINLKSKVSYKPQITIENQKNDGLPPYLTFKKTNADDDNFIGAIGFNSVNDASQDVTYASILGQMTDITDGTEDGKLTFTTYKNGSNKSFVIDGGDISISGDLIVEGGDISGPVDGSLTIKADTDLIFQVDSDNDGTETFQFKDGAGTEICTISEAGIVTAASSGVFTSGVTITGYNNLPAGLAMNADNNDDNGDSWYFLAYNNDTFSFTNNKSGTYVEMLGIATNATATDSIVTTAGKLKVSGNVIQASDGGDTITLDTDDNVTAGASFISGGSLYLPKAASALADITNKGQLWVKNTTPNELWYTEPGGTDIQITSGTSIAGANAIQIASVTIDESGMNALHSTEQQIVAAQGANKIIMPTSCFLIIDRDASTAQSSSTADLFISYNGATSLSEVIYYQRRFMYNESGDRILHLQHYTGEVAQAITDGEDRPLTVKLDSAITSGSIDSMKVVVSYHVFDNS